MTRLLNIAGTTPRTGLTLLAALGLSVGCSTDDFQSEFALTFEAPPLTTYGAGEVQLESFLPLVFEDFTMPGGVPVTGQVTDGGGAPLVGAEVRFVSLLTGVVLESAVTDGAGGYFTDLAAGTYEVVVASGVGTLGDMTLPNLAVAAGGPALQDFQFAPNVPLAGTIFEELGPVIPGALLDFTGAQTGAVISVVADGFGDFAAMLPPDVYDVVVSPVGGASATQLIESFATTVSTGGALDFSLTEGVTVSGTVLDDFGAALLENSLVQVILPNGSPFQPPTDVNANPLDGTYSIGPVPPGDACFRILPPGDSGFPVQEFVLPVLAGAPQLEDFPLLAGFVLSGTILQEGGLTPEDLVNVLPIPTDGSLAPLNVLTDATGLFAVSMFPGAYAVSFLPELTNFQLPEQQTLNISGDTLFDVTLTTGALLSGIVTEPGGVFPAADVLVSISGVLGAQGLSDVAGNYSFLAPVGTHVLEMEAQDGSFSGFSLADLTGVSVPATGPQTLDIQMILAIFGSTLVQGTVFQPDGVTPAVGVLITATDSDTGAVIGRSISTLGGDYLLVVD